MLWGYFDESGEHDPRTGRLRRLILAGCIAHEDTWNAFSLEWAAALQAAGVETFHMNKFENYQGEFRNWSEGRHRTLLSTLLACMAKYIPIYVAFSSAITQPNGDFRKAYQDGLNGILGQAFNVALEDEHIGIVLAETDQYKLPHLVKYWSPRSQEGNEGGSSEETRELARWAARFHARAKTLRTAKSGTCCPLQAADLYAYEVKKSIENGPTGPVRFPLQRLRGNGESTSWYHR